jgi:toxin-antitoxin system PIN domain toxin
MMLFDVNVLVYAYRGDAPDHVLYRDWLENTVNSPLAYGVSDLVLSGFLRIVTHPRVFAPPSPIVDAMRFVDVMRNRPHAVPIRPTERHWPIFKRLCETVGARGNLIPDAFLAALAIDSGSEWITTDRDYSRFPGLHWRHPLH